MWEMVSYRLCGVRWRGNSTGVCISDSFFGGLRRGEVLVTKRHVADFSVAAVRQASHALEFQRRLVAV